MIEYIIIAGIILIQIWIFIFVLKRINRLRNFFPNKNQLKVINKVITFNDETINVDLIEYNENVSYDFKETVESTNSYLKNNKGSAADFNIIKDITERHIDTIINNINSTISAPLFIGLAGTFFGIIYGLSFLDFSQTNNGVSVLSSESIGLLISGVVTAMFASAAGLILTLINSAWLYKDALYKNEQQKNNYYDFIQANLLPKLSKDVSDSLGTLKSNLDQFNNKFGQNLINYRESFALLNDNLVKQKEFLDAIQEVGLRKLSTQIVKTFEQINDASNEFHDFRKYQSSLNKNVSASIGVLQEYNQIIETFKHFNSNLDLVADHIDESSDFYNQFKKFLEVHFSEVEHRRNIFTNSIEQIDNVLTKKLKELSEKTIKQKDFYNEQWRKTVDELNKDIVKLFSKMTSYVQIEAESLKKYISTEEHGLQQIFEDNKQFFKDFKYVEQLFNKFSVHTEVTHKHYENIEESIKNISELLSNDASIINVNKNLIKIREAIEKLYLLLNHKNQGKDE